MPDTDVLVVGAGLTGAVTARSLADAGIECRVVEKRPHPAGNCYDYVHSPSKIRVHAYGPHLFRTKKRNIWEFANRFGEFYEYRHVVKTWVGGRWENWPVSGECIRRMTGGDTAPAIRAAGEPGNFREAALMKMPLVIYELFVKGYTEKQWGAPDTELAPELAGRFRVAWDDDPQLHSEHPFQGLPVNGYTALVENMLEGIDVRYEYDWLERRGDISCRHLVFTGPLDMFFERKLGALKYRGQRYETEYHPETVGFKQPAAVCNYPDERSCVRATEWKRMLPPHETETFRGTVLTMEYPFTPDAPDQFAYPYPDASNQSLAGDYKRLAAGLPDVTICGRLGDYRYFDMDHAMEAALRTSERLVKKITDFRTEKGA